MNYWRCVENFFNPDWQIDNGFFNKPIVACSQILVHSEEAQNKYFGAALHTDLHVTRVWFHLWCRLPCVRITDDHGWGKKSKRPITYSCVQRSYLMIRLPHLEVCCDLWTTAHCTATSVIKCCSNSEMFIYFWLIVEFKLSVLVDISSSTSNWLPTCSRRKLKVGDIL